MDWQPIETAPRDGTVILVFQGAGDGFYTEKGQIGTARWREQLMLGGSMTWCAADCCDGVTTYDNATHWMPLPAPPAPRQERG